MPWRDHREDGAREAIASPHAAAASRSASVKGWRREAARASQGGSAGLLHEMFLDAARDLALEGVALDFGAGTGDLSRRLVETGRFEAVVAVDLVRYSDEPRGCPRVLADLNEPLPFADAAFDCVLACEAIEHLENPRALAREWARILRRGGALLLSTPNNESIRSLVSLAIRGSHVAFSDSCYPAHITALVRKDLGRILAEAGFEPPRFRCSGRGALPGLTRWTWAQLSFGLLSGLRFSDNLFLWTRRR